MKLIPRILQVWHCSRLCGCGEVATRELRTLLLQHVGLPQVLPHASSLVLPPFIFIVILTILFGLPTAQKLCRG
jgi:hypothetical protein